MGMVAYIYSPSYSGDRQKDGLNLGVQDHPRQRSKIPSLEKKKSIVMQIFTSVFVYSHVSVIRFFCDMNS
jgi:hypothetical protein